MGSNRVLSEVFFQILQRWTANHVFAIFSLKYKYVWLRFNSDFMQQLTCIVYKYLVPSFGFEGRTCKVQHFKEFLIAIFKLEK